MDLVTGLRTKAARERAWLIGDQNWMRRWLLERANAGQSSNLELKSRFGAKCLEIVAAHGLLRKAISNHWEEQPRVPAGSGVESGRWTRLAGDVPGIGHNQEPPLVPKIRDGVGHHPVAEQAYKDRGLSREATEVFKNAKTGKLLEPQNNYFDEMHRTYNKAVSELLDGYIEKNGMKSEAMTAEQARGFVREVLRSSDPRIKDLNLRIFRGEILGILKRRIGGRE